MIKVTLDKIIMLPGVSNDEVSAWHQELHDYEKRKRTKRPFGTLPPPTIATVHQVYQKEAQYHPILAQFRDESLKDQVTSQESAHRTLQASRYIRNQAKSHDMRRLLSHNEELLTQRHQCKLLLDRKKQIKEPIPEQFNPINGEKLSEEYLEKKNLQISKQYRRQVVPKPGRPYDILSGNYTPFSNRSSDFSQVRTTPLLLSHLEESNPEQDYELLKVQLLEARANHRSFGQNNKESLPPIENGVSRRYQIRRIVEDEHSLRGQYQEDRREIQARNRIHNSKIPFRELPLFLSYLKPQKEEHTIKARGFD